MIIWHLEIRFDDAGSDEARDLAAGALAVLLARLVTEHKMSSDQFIINTEEAQ